MHKRYLFSSIKSIACIFLLGLATVPAYAEKETTIFQTEKHRVKAEIITEDLEYPWSLAFLPDGKMLVTEKPGRLRLIDKDGKLNPSPIAGVPKVKDSGQGGLMDIILHPKFNENRWIYISYSATGDGGYGTEVARAKLIDQQLKELEVIFRALPKKSGGRHFGSRLLFDKAGKLFLTIGERGKRSWAQELDKHPGSTIRLNDDGSVPKDNPFINNSKAKPEIYTYGNRNAQGMALHPETNEIWLHEHGPQGGDEINIIKAGVNYGWPVITYGVNYVIGTKIGEGTAKAGMEQPLHYWDPSIAPSGMAFYTGSELDNWKGDLFVGSLVFESLVRLELKGNKVTHEERLFENEFGRIRDVRMGPDEYLYFLVDDSEGLLIRLRPI